MKRERKPLNMRWFVGLCLFLSLAYMGWVAFLTVTTEINYLREDRFFTWLSGAQMLALSFLAVGHVYLNGRLGSQGLAAGPSLVWVSLAALFFYFAVDEAFEFHEGGLWLIPLVDAYLGLQISPFVGEGAVLVAYGLLGGPPLLLVRRQSRESVAPRFLLLGLVLLGACFTVDHLVPLYVELTALVEESLKFVGFTSLVIAFVLLFEERLTALMAGIARSALLSAGGSPSGRTAEPLGVGAAKPGLVEQRQESG
ncbi:MAG: hypothetical protein ACE5E0_03330 [Terriglobia bacterium]